jgi:acyl-CoA thioester hydrolase
MQTLLQLAVRWADLDVNGHVRHSVYYDFGAQARIVALEAVGLGLRWMAANQIGPVLFREQASFRREVRMGDELTIDTQLAGLSADSRKWRIAHHIRRGEELCASLDLDGAWMDLKARRIITPPEELRTAFQQLPRSETFTVL